MNSQGNQESNSKNQSSSLNFLRDREDNFYQPTNFCNDLFEGRTSTQQNRHYQTCMFAYN